MYYYYSYLNIPEEFLNTVDHTISPPGPPLGSQPEWGMITMLTRYSNASSIIGRFKSCIKVKLARKGCAKRPR